MVNTCVIVILKRYNNSNDNKVNINCKVGWNITVFTCCLIIYKMMH